MSLIEDLNSLASDIFERWDKDMRSGKILTALEGRIANYDPRVTRIREALAKVDGGSLRVITSQDCKEFLSTTETEFLTAVEATTGLRRKSWKRVRKFTDAEGRACREFANTGIPMIVVLAEANGDLTVVRERGIGMWEKAFEPFENWYVGTPETRAWEETHLWPTLRAEDFAFGRSEDEGEFSFFFQPKTVQAGEVWDQHAPIDHLLPTELHGGEVCESTFVFGHGDGDDVTHRLIALGFTHDPKLDGITGS